MSEKCLVRVWVYSISLQFDQKKTWISHQNNWILAVKKKRSYIQAFIKWLKVDVVLFVNQRCSFWFTNAVCLLCIFDFIIAAMCRMFSQDVFVMLEMSKRKSCVAVSVSQRSFSCRSCAYILPDATVIAIFIIENTELCWGPSASEPESENSRDICLADFCFQDFFS